MVVKSILCISFLISFFFPKSEKTHFLLGNNEENDTETNENLRFVYNDILYSSYFSNLLFNFGNNQTESTCGYVALGMLLSYYDNIVNDYIVDDNFEVDGLDGQSNGTLHEPNITIPSPDNVPAYYNFLRNYVDSSLHAYLILLDKNALLINPPNNYIASTYRDEFGTNEQSLAALSYSYLVNKNINQYCSIVYNTSYNTSYSVSNVLNMIKNEIDNDRPVLCGYKGHAYIAYGYSITTNLSVLHVHNGYVGQTTSGNLSIDVNNLTGNNWELGYLSLHFSFGG